jgi:prepilin-type N-terminal cleavage/methylation domain-containing protein
VARRGFTIAELLVVIGLLVILAALLAPTLAGAGAAARDREALSAARQTAVLLLDRATSTNDHIPQGKREAGETDVNYAAGYWWRQFPEITLPTGRLDPRFAVNDAYANWGFPHFILTGAAVARDAEFDPDVTYYTRPSEAEAAQRRFSEVAHPGEKVMAHERQRGEDEIQDTYCCYRFDVRVAHARFDGSAFLARVIDFKDHQNFDPILLRGIPAHTTWYGLKGRDRLISE